MVVRRRGYRVRMPATTMGSLLSGSRGSSTVPRAAVVARQHDQPVVRIAADVEPAGAVEDRDEGAVGAVERAYRIEDDPESGLGRLVVILGVPPCRQHTDVLAVAGVEVGRRGSLRPLEALTAPPPVGERHEGGMPATALTNQAMA